MIHKTILASLTTLVIARQGWPGSLWILSPEGKHLGTIIGPKHPHNFTWGERRRKNALHVRAQRTVSDEVQYRRHPAVIR